MAAKDSSKLFEIEKKPQIVTNKLPSNLEVLQNLFYYTRDLKLNLHDSATLVCDNVISFWNDAEIPIRKKGHIITKIENLQQTWRDFQKKFNKSSNKEHDATLFEIQLDELFDIAHANALTDLDLKRANFLTNQRQPGRVETLTDLKASLSEIESVSSTKSLSGSSLSVSDLSKSLEEYVPGSQKSIASDDSPPAKRSRGTINICTPRVVTVLDKCKITNRDASHLLVAFLEAVELDPNDYMVSKSSIHTKRIETRQEMFTKIKEEFSVDQFENLVVHWDGKLLPDIVNQERVDRLPVILSSNGIVKLLSVCKLENSSGKSQAEAIFETLQEWAVSSAVKGFCCDTTASNLGRINGAAVLLEQFLERDILYFPCRHHILEIILRSAYEVLIPGTVGPNVQLFQRFQNSWNELDKEQWESGLSDPVVFKVLEKDLQKIESFIQRQLLMNFEREDYKELLDLSLLFINVKPKEGYVIRKPGAVHHARWMSKAIYSIKIFLFRKSFHLNKNDALALQQICIFIVKIYIKHWFTAEIPEKAPKNDLTLIKDCYQFKLINQKISNATIKKVLNHQWYLTPENASLAFFDDNVTFVEKKT